MSTDFEEKTDFVDKLGDIDIFGVLESWRVLEVFATNGKSKIAKFSGNIRGIRSLY
jgi:hypothetical protein